MPQPRYNVAVSCDQHEFDVISAAAKATGWTMSHLIKRALSHYLASREFRTVAKAGGGNINKLTSLDDRRDGS